MDPNPETAEISDTIVVGGDYSEESHDESDQSIYGEGEEGQEQGQEEVEPDAANDDYARTFDSPAANELQSEAEEAQPDVSMASESMTSPSAPDPLTGQSPAAAAPSSDHPSPPLPPALPQTNGSAQAPGTGTSAPAEQSQIPGTSHSEPPPSSAPNASPSSSSPSKAPATAFGSAAPEEQVPAASAPQAASPTAPAGPAPEPADEGDLAPGIDIQKLVDDITAKATATTSPPSAPAQAAPVTTQAAPVTAQAAPAAPFVSHPPSLPPKPSLPNPPASLPAIPQFRSRGPHAPASPAVPLNIASPIAQHGAYVANEGISSLPPPPPGPFSGGPSHPHAHHMPLSGDAVSSNYHAMPIKQRWEQFQADEKRYTSEARWERFPEGSRIFIGNLSSERVSKREVFDVFHVFGRLAQISLKNAYGFVQYHTVAEGQAAMQGAQGIELGGRRIHLEISRAQKKKDERDRSPDRRAARDVRGANGRYDMGEHGRRRDDYRPGRSPSPRRSDIRGGRDGPYARDRDFGGPHARRRSRSPARYGRYGDESYRRRSPSPHRRVPSESDRFDLPRRFGSDVPDVQILLLQEVSRDFVGWVQGAFHTRGLKTDVMYLNPRFPRDTVVQRQVVEGVLAIVDLDYTAQSQGKIPIQVFIRSGGSSVRFELYQGVDPPVAAELVMREKSQHGVQLAQSHPPYVPNGYGQQPRYPTEAAPAGYPYQYPPQSVAPAQPQAAPPPAADLASVVGQLDNSALQALLASLQNPQASTAAHAPHSAVPPASAQPQAAQIDMNALFGNLRSVAAAAPPAPVPGAPAPGVPSYGAAPPYAPPAAPAAAVPGGGYGGGVDAAHVQTILEQLNRPA
ncbi:uncharacterized protein THITE_2117295 [Thermothielavioides terrestris NRRL 8126]|uniref:RRM domain-containing protein n=1 Tax=Thermothielavioides terrestris (strain ATCC 38088 / NRRL 8126) TaxID=578455 RepID=G2R7V5_THETT|nr:uncharacterized protein THITE_2117295 [Thermothielavioides terrestris NRRL 8126]AEO68014.1 hypothetical protein THITE_2117295 [Thermothielavioides terrestris NRRL 8126]